jgi:hypothetical protein
MGTISTALGSANLTNVNYLTVASLSLAAGSYHISGSGLINNQTGSPVDVACNVVAGASTVATSTTSVLAQYDSLAFDGVLTVTATTQVNAQCISNPAPAPGPLASVRLVAQLVPAVVGG